MLPVGRWAQHHLDPASLRLSLLSADTCYVLSFAIIMLNTSLHNPNVRDKPGLDRFISMNRGINEGGDLPEDLLRVCCVPTTGFLFMHVKSFYVDLFMFSLIVQNLYESIKNEPFKIPEDDGNDLTHTFFNPDREGWLLKLGEMMPLTLFHFNTRLAQSNPKLSWR